MTAAIAPGPTEGIEPRELWVVQLGVMGYEEALEIQRAAARARISGEVPQDLLILVEHPPVITLGRSAKASNLLSDREDLASKGVELFEVERGGDVTFHGPGQVVGYTIVDLKRHRRDLHWILRQIEEALIRTLAAYGIAADRDIGRTGVWTSGRKIASIGLHARDWVTWHGFALNVMTDLSYFDLMVPCGLEGVSMTSIAREAGISGNAIDLPVTTEAAGNASAAELAEVLGLKVRVIDVSGLAEKLLPASDDRKPTTGIRHPISDI